jgi:tetratricopeptide (TPR) repeat protein
VAGAEPRTLKVRCATWDQVEAFLGEKLRGSKLVVKVPFPVRPTDVVTIALGLPGGLVFAIEGRVEKLGKEEAGRYPVMLEMYGLTPQARSRLVRLIADGRAGHASQLERLPEPTPAAVAATRPAPAPPEPEPEPIPETEEGAPPRLEDVIPAEQPVFRELAAAQERFLQLHTHDVLGVGPDADLASVRRAYFALTKRYHPDVYGRYRSPAVRALASEVFIHVNKAYDRLREAARAALGEAVPGPAWRNTSGWLASADDFQAASAEPAPAAAEVPPPPADEPMDDTPFDTANPRSPLSEDALFGDLGQLDGNPGASRISTSMIGAREAALGKVALDERRWQDARRLFAEALRQDPRHREVRALYHVACGMELRVRGAAEEALVQFETALTYNRECREALRALGRLADERGTFRA